MPLPSTCVFGITKIGKLQGEISLHNLIVGISIWENLKIIAFNPLEYFSNEKMLHKVKVSLFPYFTLTRALY